MCALHAESQVCVLHVYIMSGLKYMCASHTDTQKATQLHVLNRLTIVHSLTATCFQYSGLYVILLIPLQSLYTQPFKLPGNIYG